MPYELQPLKSVGLGAPAPLAAPLMQLLSWHQKRGHGVQLLPNPLTIA
jgi:hypothetical protein